MTCYSHYLTYDNWNSYSACVWKMKNRLYFGFALVSLLKIGVIFVWKDWLLIDLGDLQTNPFNIIIEVAHLIKVCITKQFEKRTSKRMSFVCGFAKLWGFAERVLLFHWSMYLWWSGRAIFGIHVEVEQLAYYIVRQ